MKPRVLNTLLLATLLLAWVLRVPRLDAVGPEIDEVYSLRLATYGPADIVRGTAADQHPPLYYFLLHAWLGLAGQSLFALRLLSALVALATVALLYRVGSSFNRQAGLLAAALLAISPAHIHYSQQARMYALFLFLGTTATWLAWRWWSLVSARGWKGSLAYVAVMLATLYSHNFALLLLAVHGLAGMVLAFLGARQSRPQLAVRWLTIQAIILLGFLPWVPAMIGQVTQHGMDWIPAVDWPVIRHSWHFLLFYRDWSGSLLDILGAILGAALVLLALLPRRQAGPGGRFLSWTLAWFLVPVLLLIAVSAYRPVYQSKQLLFVLPALLLLLSVGMLRLRGRLWAGLLIASFVALTAVALYQEYQNPKHEQWDGLVAYLNAHMEDDDVLYVNAAAGSLALRYYLPGERAMAGYPPDYDLLRGGWAGERTTAERVETQLGALTERYSRVWVVEFGPQMWDPEGHILAWFQEKCRLLDSQPFGYLRLWLFAAGPGQ